MYYLDYMKRPHFMAQKAVRFLKSAASPSLIYIINSQTRYWIYKLTGTMTSDKCKRFWEGPSS